jgi:thioredoxin-dependent peroxiredoxin
MNRLLTALFTSAILVAPAHAALKAGDAAPDFQAKASLAGKAFDFSLKSALKKGPVVVYFYPSAYTQGCNIQAREFAQNMDKFAAAGATIVGVSMDSIERLNDFSADPEYCGGKVAVSSDADGSIARSYDLKITAREGVKDSRGVEISHGFIERTTFVVTPDGRIAATISGVPAAENVKQALAAVEQLKGTRVGQAKSGGRPAPM